MAGLKDTLQGALDGIKGQTDMENAGRIRHQKETPKVFKKAKEDDAFGRAAKVAPKKGQEILDTLEK
jgi:hypothetical protein